MKTKYKTKNHFSIFLASVSCFILLLSISSCELFTFSKLEENENAANASEQLSSSNTCNLHITPRFGSESLNSNYSSRSAFPDFSSFYFLGYTFKATSTVLLGEVTGAYNSNTGNISFSFSNATFSEPTEFTFYICNSSGKELFYGTQQITYTTLGSEISKTVYFRSYNSSEVNGHINLKVAVTSDYTLSCEIKNSSEESVCGNTGDPISVDSSGNITTGTDGIAPGTYKAYISVKKGSQLYDYIIQEINVWPDLTTNLWYLPDGTKSQTYNIEISENKIKLYVKGTSPSGLYGSSGLTGVAQPLDTNSGAIMHPLASLSAAISKCTDSSTQYTIICDGSIAGCNIGSQSTPNNCTITIRGGGNSSGYSRISTRGLTIYTNKAITLENIKISTLTSTAIQYTSSATSADLSLKNCEITNNKMVGNVGGIKLNSANLHLQGKIVITGNAWRNNSGDTTGSQKNVILNSPNLIIIDGPLDSSSRIGVTYSVFSPASFCPGFATSCPGLDPKIIFSADFDEYEIKENGDDDPCIAQLPLYAEVNARQYYTLSATVNAIKDSSGTITVVLYEPVSQTDLGPSSTEGTILNAIKSKTSNVDSVNLSVATGESITLTDSLKDYFKGCERIISVNLTGFNTSNVTSMESLFDGCNGLSSLDLTGFNTANVTSMESMFYDCYGLSSLDLSGFNTENVTSMEGMFYGCNALSSLDLSGFNTENVTSMESMFYDCYGLSSLDLSSFNTANVTSMICMFYGCTALTRIVVGNNFVTTSITSTSSSTNMFAGCDNLVGGNGTTLGSVVNHTYARVDVTGTPGYFSSLYAKVGNTACISKADTITAIDAATGDIELVLSNNVTASDIGAYNTANSIAYAIKNNTNVNSIHLVLPTNITTLNTSAFFNCAKIKGELRIPASLNPIPSQAFMQTGITSLVLPSGITTVGIRSFSGCASLSSITWNNIQKLDTESFASCSSLHEVTIPSTTTIISHAFGGAGLTSLTFSDPSGWIKSGTNGGGLPSDVDVTLTNPTTNASTYKTTSYYYLYK